MVILITNDLIVVIAAAAAVAAVRDNLMANVMSCELQSYIASPACAILLFYFGTTPVYIKREIYLDTLDVNIYIKEK